MLENLVLLLERALYAREASDKKKFENIKCDIVNCYNTYFEDSDTFINTIKNRIEKSREVGNVHDEENIVRIIAHLRNKSDSFSDWMEPEFGLLCDKIAYRLVEALGDSYTFLSVKMLWRLASSYAYMQNFRQEFRCYDEAIAVSRKACDMTLEYLAITRKLARLIFIVHNQTLYDLDESRRNTEEDLIKLAQAIGVPISDIPDYFINREFPVEPTSMIALERKDFVCTMILEVTYTFPAMFALSRGDEATTEHILFPLYEAYKKSWGEEKAYNHVASFIDSYKMNYDSSEREEYHPDEEIELFFDPEFDPIRNPAFDIPFSTSLSWKKQIEKLTADILDLIHLKCHKSAHNYVDYLICLTQSTWKDHYIAFAITLKAEILKEENKIEEAELYYKEALDLLNKSIVSEELECQIRYLKYQTLQKLGQLCIKTNARNAVDYLTKGSDLLMDGNPDYYYWKSNLLQERGEAWHVLGNISKGDQDMIDAANIVVNEVKSRIPFMDSDNRDCLWTKELRFFDELFLYVDRESSKALKVKAYDIVLLSKGLMLMSERILPNILESERESLGESAMELYKEIRNYEEIRPAWGSTPEESIDNNYYINEYFNNIQLASIVKPCIKKHYSFMDFCLEDVISLLDENDVVIDFFNYVLPNKDIKYCAFIVRKDMEEPIYVELCTESELSSVFDEFTEKETEVFHLSDIYRQDKPYSERIYSLIWKPIADTGIIDDDKVVYFIPIGSLHKIAVESLWDGNVENKYLSQTYRRFVRLSHAREIRNTKARFTIDSIQLYGGIDYGTGSNGDTDNRGYRIASNSGVATELHPWLKLNATRQEVSMISFLLLAQKTKSNVLQEKDATAQSFVDISGKSPCVLHFATHGFFESRHSVENLPALKGRQNPMDLSGIVFANGNTGWLYGNSMTHEGILTATEIARLDLSNTELVVLSACYTGDGLVRSDGVFGLQRAFKKAGVKSLILSLWNEDDESGCRMMIEFYSRLINNGLDRHEAFESAKNEIRRNYPHPSYWAGFIMID
ncbi:MAG: CHAT domain-containing protein [Bacteroidales bacterium]|nr:CHAT domain-containing protein [Candidatus Liminaster caballi]